MRFIAKLQKIIKYAVQIWNTARPTQLAAALAYYGMMSLPPLLLIIYLLGRFLLVDFVPPSNNAISSTTPTDLGGSWLLTIIGILLLLLAASKVFLELQMALNRIWGAPPSRHRGVLSYINKRFNAILMLVGLGVILIVPILLEYEWSNLELGEGLKAPVTNIEGPAIYLFFALAFAVIYKEIPNLPLAWRDVLLAAFIVAGLVLLGGWVVFSFMSTFSINTPFEVFSLLTLILVSVNYLSLIVVLGVVFCRCYAMVFGSMKVETMNGSRTVSP
jgi:membrane protein